MPLQREVQKKDDEARQARQWLDQAQGQLQNTQTALNTKEKECLTLEEKVVSEKATAVNLQVCTSQVPGPTQPAEEAFRSFSGLFALSNPQQATNLRPSCFPEELGSDTSLPVRRLPNVNSVTLMKLQRATEPEHIPVACKA